MILKLLNWMMPTLNLSPDGGEGGGGGGEGGEGGPGGEGGSGDEGASGGGEEGSGSATKTILGKEPGTEADVTVLKDKWKEAVDPQYGKDPILGNLKNLDDLAKGYIEQKKFIGNKRLEAPSETWTEEDWGKLYNQLGRPENPDGYNLTEEIEKPEGFEPSEERMKQFSEVAHKVGLSKKQAAELAKWQVQNEAQALKQLQEQRENAATGALNNLKSEWKDNYDANIDVARAALREFADEDFISHLETSGLGNDPRIIKVFHNIGRSMMEDSPTGRGRGLNVQDSTSAQAEIQNLMVDESFQKALNSRQHPQHQAALERWTLLHKRAYAKTETTA